MEKVDRNLAEELRNRLPEAVRPTKEETLLAMKTQQLVTPEARSALVQALRTRAREADTTTDLTAPMTTAATAIKLKKPTTLYTITAREVEKPETRRRIIPLSLLMLQTETPQYAEPPTRTPEPFGDILKYSPPLLTTTATPTAANVPSPLTYPPVTVPKIGEVPTADVPTVPSREAPPPAESLPRRWWRLLPPHIFFSDRTGEGAYRVQEGKKQILALA
jgi:hypothetical protein